MDTETGYYFYNARHYDPVIARFVTADSVVDGELSPMGWNRYMYVHGNPVVYLDPTGHNTYMMYRKVQHPVPGTGMYFHSAAVITQTQKELDENFSKDQHKHFESIKLEHDVKLGKRIYKKGTTLRYRILSANRSDNYFTQKFVHRDYKKGQVATRSDQLLLKSASGTAYSWGDNAAFDEQQAETYNHDKNAFLDILKQNTIKPNYLSIFMAKNVMEGTNKYSARFRELEHNNNNTKLLDQKILQVYNSYNNGSFYAAFGGTAKGGENWIFNNCNSFAATIAYLGGAKNWRLTNNDRKQLKMNKGSVPGNQKVMDYSFFENFRFSKEQILDQYK